ncbi:NAD(P)-dependent oxidoreductase [Microbacterium sp. NPDC076911]|uniref:NAD(P)-dependent oxidoreductase n=1 Tax=Microbacterium sp. NPDC076911 TaxID=3154958 RepID=UPI003442C854
MAPVGFLGLGRMGLAIAGRLSVAGVPLQLWNRSWRDSMDAVLSDWATRVDTAAEALASPISFSMLADDDAAEAVLSRVNLGTSEHARVHVNMASLSVRMGELLTRRCEEAGIVYVAAPVLGRPEVAVAGNLNVLLAGPSPALNEVEPLLALFSKGRWPLGEVPRQANAVKIAMNFMLLHALESMGEGIALVEAEGVSADAFVDIFTNTFFGGMVHSIYGGMIAERRYSPAGFSMALGLKDLSLAEQLAAESKIDVATAPVLRDRFETALADPELADLDWSAIAEISRSQGSEGSPSPGR